LGVSQRATATNILAVSQAPNSSNNYIPGYTLALQTDKRKKISTDSFKRMHLCLMFGKLNLP
jgi:hypothetical protein